MTPVIRPCQAGELPVIAEIVNAAAEKYRGVIPADVFHDPYMSRDELAREIAAGVEFWGCETEDGLAAVMGMQTVKGQALIRHAYVRPACQRHGLGSKLLDFLLERTAAPILVGTWADAAWAIRFYEKHGFVATQKDAAVHLLETYWTVSRRQIETSVVLAYAP